ncbi:hypothetical protein F5148DRAFT_1162633 [Russula earlei]|uniref:Uncharacterized protein n=1 Tax=Russula earlei TaxID=71964 RepID=A0ACC0UNC4_9AGAM|nr:hypothetical protein F5148DRAFT_1162633 [Russula earlei]
MPRSRDAKEWRPDSFGQEMIDKMTNLILVTERCAAELRSFDFPSIKRLWAQVLADFQGDPVKYPSSMPNDNDVEGRKQFRMKCEAICFPPKSELPRSPEDIIMMYFAAHAGLQSITSQDLSTHPYGGEIDYRAGLQVLKELKGQAAYDAAVEFDNNLREKPLDLVHETFSCRDNGKTVEYTVVDCMTTMVSGDEYLVLQSREGQKKQVTMQEFYEMRVD